MSIQSMCSKDRIEIRRETTVRSDGGEGTKTWAAATRTATSLPALDVKCRRQQLTSEEAIAAGVTSGKESWNLFFYFDPKIDKRDRVFFTDNGIAHETEVSNPSWQYDTQNRLWQCTVTKFGPGKR